MKQDVYEIVKGPCPDDAGHYLLASLSDLRQQYLAAIHRLKKKEECIGLLTYLLQWSDKSYFCDLIFNQ